MFIWKKTQYFFRLFIRFPSVARVLTVNLWCRSLLVWPRHLVGEWDTPAPSSLAGREQPRIKSRRYALQVCRWQCHPLRWVQLWVRYVHTVHPTFPVFFRDSLKMIRTAWFTYKLLLTRSLHQNEWKRHWLKIHPFLIKITTFRGTQSASSGEEMCLYFFHLKKRTMFRETSWFLWNTDGFLISVVSIYFGLNYFNPSPTLHHEFVLCIVIGAGPTNTFWTKDSS